MNQTAVVILNYNGEDYLKKFLPSVITYSKDAEVIVVDNKSTDQSIEVLANDFPEVKVIEFAENYGYAGGYNKALERIDATYVVLLNSDIEVTPNWLTPLIDFLDTHPDYAACQPKIKDFNDQTKFEYAGASGGYLDSLGYPYCRGRIFNTIEKDLGQYDQPADIFWATGACLVIKTEIFNQVGGLDTDFFAHMEEIDLCWRIQSMGLKIKAVPSSQVYHVGGGTLSKLNPTKTYLNFRNGLYMLIKNLPGKDLLLKIPIRITLDWIAALKFIFEGNTKHGFAVWRAHFSMLAKLSIMLKKRVLTSPILSKKVVITDYYLRGKRKFDEL